MNSRSVGTLSVTTSLPACSHFFTEDSWVTLQSVSTVWRWFTFETFEFVYISLTRLITQKACNGKLIKAHKVVLGLSSSYFEEIFTSLGSTQHPVLILDCSAALMSSLLEFIYLGSVNVKQENLQDFMAVAEKLKIKGLTASTRQINAVEINSLKEPNNGNSWTIKCHDVFKTRQVESRIADGLDG